ncbi:glycosyltransferase family 39 protein [Treponema zioleckii]|uniref:glycosyltransferase family 39 protein n=1 Tax=Treponema zioleckii TaxID=331680 RepID=UPI00168BFF8E|nr:glycosyltransferase family 39 protein [Treponema zioleckii]
MMDKLLQRLKCRNALIFTFLAFYAVFITMQSTLAPYSKVIPWVDSHVFIYVAKVLLNGGRLYTDVFDHKGPLLYFINAIGLSLHEYTGIWLIEFLSIFLAMLFAFKTARLVFSRTASLISVLLSFAYLIETFGFGNYTENYALPYILLTQFIFLRLVHQQKDLTKLKIMLVGSMFSFTFLLRPNLVFLWVLFCVYILLVKIREKKYKQLWTYVGYFFTGSFIILLPVAVYFICLGNFSDFIKDYFLYNIRYATAEKDFAQKINAIEFFINNDIVKLSLVLHFIAIYLNREKKFYKNIFCINALGFFFAFFIVVSPANNFSHYATVLIPFMVLPIANLIEIIFKELKFNPLLSIAAILGLFIFILCPYFSKQSKQISWKSSGTNISYALVEYIQNNTEESEKIIVDSNDCWVYTKSHRWAASRFAYRPWPMTQEMNGIFAKEIKENKPKFVISRNENSDILQILQDAGLEYKLNKKIDDFYIFSQATSGSNFLDSDNNIDSLFDFSSDIK